MLTSASSAWNPASYASAISRRRLGLEARGDEHPVLAPVEPLVAQVADVGDVLHVEHRDAVVQQRPADEVGEEVAAQVADVRPAVDGRARRCTSGPRAVRRERTGSTRGQACCGGGRRHGQGPGGGRCRRCYRRCPKSPSRGRNGSPGRSFLSQRPRTNDIVPPAVWHGEASFPARLNGPRGRGRERRLRHTPAVRRWVCIIALLAGFSGSGYAWTASPRIPVPVERRRSPRGVGRRAIPGPDWWLRASIPAEPRGVSLSRPSRCPSDRRRRPRPARRRGAGGPRLPGVLRGRPIDPSPRPASTGYRHDPRGPAGVDRPGAPR